VAEFKAGDVYRELGEDDSAEAYYRRAFAVATDDERSEATLRIATHLIETGREQEAAAFVAQQRPAASAPGESDQAQLPAVGRNEPCPCGSGKKYKKCHGA
jgi:preprotein translocase subunit SecA